MIFRLGFKAMTLRSRSLLPEQHQAEYVFGLISFVVAFGSRYGDFTLPIVGPIARTLAFEAENVSAKAIWSIATGIRKKLDA